MRILHISTGVQKIPPDRVGSPEGHISFMSKYLVKMGHEVTILDRKYSPFDPSLEQVDGINIVRLPVKSFPPSALEGKFPFLYWIRSGLNTTLFTFKVNKCLKQAGEFDVMNTYVISLTFLLLILNKGLNGKIFYNHHAAFWPSQSGGILNRLLLLLGSFTMKRVKRTIVQNDSQRSHLIRCLKLAEQKFVVLPPGIDMHLSSSNTKVNDIKAKYQLNGRKLILFVGRINQMKGLEYLVRAANIVINQYNYEKALFLLVGPFESVEIDKPGGYTARIFDLIKSFKLEDNVRLTGTVPLDDVTKLYLACDMFILPSVVEQFPLVVIEAMAAGKPVVATKTPGALMQVRDGWNGFLVEIGDEEELAEKTRYLLDNPEEARRMGANAREFAQGFDWSIIVQRYLEVFTA
ncbi:glycosyltransferase family 4 protein [Dehalococcoidia bacterium]|nr:glycosyltransferase family 4 protein [Dehalococcoidia bacterium]